MYFRLISSALMLISGLQVLVYYSPLKFRWPLALLVELWPYWSVIPCLSFILVIAIPKLRQQSARISIATLILILSLAPVLNWVGLPQLGSAPDGLRVMAYNIWIDNPNTDEIAQSIQSENPDILFLSEVNKPVMAALQTRLDYPHNYRTEGGNNALFSRYPILEATTTDFEVKTKGRTFNLMAKLQVEGDPVTIIGIHPPVPIIPRFFHIRNQQLDTYATASHSIEGKLIVLGDFNATPWSPYFQRFERLSQLQNAGHRQWIWATWYFNQTLTTRYIKIPLDHIETRGYKALKTWTGQTGGSDHKPIITVLEPT